MNAQQILNVMLEVSKDSAFDGLGIPASQEKLFVNMMSVAANLLGQRFLREIDENHQMWRQQETAVFEQKTRTLTNRLAAAEEGAKIHCERRVEAEETFTKCLRVVVETFVRNLPGAP